MQRVGNLRIQNENTKRERVNDKEKGGGEAEYGLQGIGTRKKQMAPAIQEKKCSGGHLD